MNETIEFVCELLQSAHVPAHLLRTPLKNCDWLDLGLRRQLMEIPDPSELYNRLLSSLEEKTVYHITDMFQCTYTILKLPDSGEWLFCGPVLFENADASRIIALLHDRRLSEALAESLQEYYYQLTLWSMQSWYENLFTLLANRLYGETEYKIVYQNAKELDEWDRAAKKEKGQKRSLLSIQQTELCYELENKIIAAVSANNEGKALSALSRLQSLPLSPHHPNELRNQKIFCITLNALLRKTAEQTKVYPLQISTVSSRNIHQIEQLTSRKDCQSFQRKMVQEYCRLIQENNLKKYTPFVRKVIACVDDDLNADLSLNALAKLLSVNASYLSALFKKEMGVTLSSYVSRRRMEQAQKLLLCTDLPIKSIAQQCGIADIYYFNHLFKRITGLTPKTYRETMTYDEFLQNQMSSRR